MLFIVEGTSVDLGPDAVKAFRAMTHEIDAAALDGLIPPLDITTAPLGYVRFHGRNAAAWRSGDSSSRYDYRYTGAELDEWVPRLKKIAAETDKTFIFTNNHWQGKAVESAIILKGLLKKEGLEAV